MAAFNVVYTETLCGSYIIEAETEGQAIEMFNALMAEEKIDTLDLEVIDTNTTVREIKTSKDLLD